jgi:hypothetical protein
MNMLVIATQDYENYAAHQGFTGEYYWKAKGGSEFKITEIPVEACLEDIVAMALPHIEQNNDYFRTEILGYRVEPQDYLSWFEQSQLEYDGEILHPEPKISYRQLEAQYTDPREFAEQGADADAVRYGA